MTTLDRKKAETELTDLERKYEEIANWPVIRLDEMRDYKPAPFEPQQQYVETYVTYGAYEKRI